MKDYLELADQFEVEKLEERTEFYWGHYYNHNHCPVIDPLDLPISA